MARSRRGAYPPDWELRPPARYVEELESDEDDGEGVYLDGNAMALRGRQREFTAGDELYFTGYDLGQARRGSGYEDQEFEDYEYEQYQEPDQRGLQRTVSYPTGSLDGDEALVKSALDQIAKAKAKGKSNVNLSQDEIDALERRRNQRTDPSRSLASPPATPAKQKSKASSRSASSTSLSAQKTWKKTSSGSGGALFGHASPSTKPNSKAKVARKPADSPSPAYPAPLGTPGVMVDGPDGVPVFQPLGQPRADYHLRDSQPGSRSASRPRDHDRTLSASAEYYTQWPPRYYTAAQAGATRPPSSQGSSRSIPDDYDWYPPPHHGSRIRSASNRSYDDYVSQQPPYPPSSPAVQGGGAGRRHVSGPPEVSYSSLRRMPPASSPLAPRPAGPPHASLSDPPPLSVGGRQGSGLSQEIEVGSTSSDDQGVQVDTRPRTVPAAEHRIERAPLSGNGGRRRRGVRR